MDTLLAQDGRLTDLAIEQFLAEELPPALEEAVRAHIRRHPDEQQRVAAYMAADAQPLPPRLPLAQDGRLTDLAIEQFLAEELPPALEEAVRAHIRRHPDEQQRVAAYMAADAQPLPPRQRAAPATTPSSPPGQVIAFPRRVWGVAAGLLAAAVALVVLLPGGPSETGDVFLRRGGLTLEVVKRLPDSDHATRLSSGDPVQAGDQLGFVVSGGTGGHLMVVGIDGSRQTYPVYPSRPGAAVAVEGGRQELQAAIELDGTPGTERLIAIQCPAPFSFADITAPLVAATADLEPGQSARSVRDGCTQHEVQLHKDVP